MSSRGLNDIFAMELTCSVINFGWLRTVFTLSSMNFLSSELISE